MNQTTSIYTLKTTGMLALVSCCSCGIVWGQPTGFERQRRADGENFYCPNGHGQHYTETTEQRLQRELDAARDATADARRSLATTKGHLTRLRKRAEAGVCLHCHRTFQNVQRHMESKHGEARP